jgi:thioredoxin 2
MQSTANFQADDRGVIVPCAKCGRSNRTPFGRLGQTGACGGCKETLRPIDSPIELDGAPIYNALIRESALPVLVDFWAPWCGPCKMVAPEVSRLASLASGKLLVAKVNTEDQQGIAATMSLRSIPTFAIFAQGRELRRTAGAMRAEDLLAFATAAS